MTKEDYSLPPGSKILVTGANGYIASHIINIFLGLGFPVRGTVRTQKSWLNKYFDQQFGPGRFETVLVPDFEQLDALSQAMDGIMGVIHVANDMSFSPDMHVISRAVKANLNVLEASIKQKSVQRVVLTSSSCAAFYPKVNQSVNVDQDSWNTVALETAWKGSCPAEMKPFVIHAASKVEAERQAWNWMRQNQPTFILNTVLPYYTLGRILHPEIGGSSMAWTRNFLKGDTSNFQFPPQWFVDVEDAARLHVIGVLSPTVQAERLFAFAAPFNWTDIIWILRKLQPENTLIPDPPVNEGRVLGNIASIDRAEKLLQDVFGRTGWTSLEDSLAAGIWSFS